MPLSDTEKVVLIGLVGELFAAATTIAHVELAEPEEIDELRDTEYATLAATVVGASVLGALTLGLEDPEEGS